MEDTRKVPVEAGLDTDKWELDESEHGRDRWIREKENGSAMKLPARKVSLSELERIQDQVEVFFDEKREEPPEEEESVGNDHPQTCYCNECVPDYERQR